MRGSQSARLSFTLVLVLVVMFSLMVTVGSGQAKAALGNAGIPVRCYKSGTVSPGTSAFLTCAAADGTPFIEGQRVPNGYYLLVLDVLITPDAGTATGGLMDLNIYDAYGTSSRRTSIRLRETRAASFGFKFLSPYLVLVAGDRLEVSSAAFSDYGANVWVTGLLVTNLNYLPAALRD